MFEEYLYKLGLDSFASLEDVKQAYRRLAKENHPDRCMDEAEKKFRQERMVVINLAYHYLIKNCKEWVGKAKSQDKSYELYKRGVDSYVQSTSVALYPFKVGSLKDLENLKLDILETVFQSLILSGKYFKRVLTEYPDSDWAYDSSERLKNHIEPDMKRVYAKILELKNSNTVAQLYQKGLELTKKCQKFTRFSGKWTKNGTPISSDYSDEKHIEGGMVRFLKELREKQSLLIEAQDCFQKIIADYPDSDWFLDAEEQCLKIKRVLDNTQKQIDKIEKGEQFWSKKSE